MYKRRVVKNSSRQRRVDMSFLVNKGLDERPRTTFLSGTFSAYQEVEDGEDRGSFTLTDGRVSRPGFENQRFDGGHFAQTVLGKRKNRRGGGEGLGDDDDESDEESDLDGNSDDTPPAKKLLCADDLVHMVQAQPPDANVIFGNGELLAMPTKDFHRLPLLHFENKILESNTDLYPVDRSVHTVQLKYKQSKIEGDKIVANMRNMFEHKLGITRNIIQTQMHNEFIKSCLPKIYGEEWQRDPESIMMRFGINECRQETIVSMPRRYGKTVGVSSFAAVYALCVPKVSIAIFANGHNMSKKLLSMLYTFMQVIGIEEQGLRITKCQAELIELQGKDKLDKRVIRALCGSVRVCFFICFLYLCFSKKKGEAQNLFTIMVSPPGRKATFGFFLFVGFFIMTNPPSGKSTHT